MTEIKVTVREVPGPRQFDAAVYRPDDRQAEAQECWDAE